MIRYRRLASLPIALCALLLVAPSARAAEGVAAAFPKGSFTLQSYATFAQGLDEDKGVLDSGVFGFSYYVWDNVSLGAEASGFYTSQGGRTGAAYSLAGVLRQHLLTFNRFTLFADVTFGPFVDDVRIPTGGTYFNFATRTGLGLTYQLQDHLYLLGGTRYFHLSNARIEGRDHNPSVNGIEGYIGLMWRL